MTRLVMLGISASLAILLTVLSKRLRRKHRKYVVGDAGPETLIAGPGWFARSINRRGTGTVDETPDPMAQPFLDSRNTATYLYNPTTGVGVSYN